MCVNVLLKVLLFFSQKSNVLLVFLVFVFMCPLLFYPLHIMAESIATYKELLYSHIILVSLRKCYLLTLFYVILLYLLSCSVLVVV